MTSVPARAGVTAGVMAWSAATAAMAVTARAALPGLLAGSATTDEAIAGLAAGLALVVLGWFALVVVTTVLAEFLPRGCSSAAVAERLGSAVSPAALRRLITAAVAGALISGVTAPAARATTPGPGTTAARACATAPAHALAARTLLPSDGRPGPADDSPVPVGDHLDPGWGQPPAEPARTPDRLDPAWGTAHRARAAAYPVDHVVVHRDDTLWDIAARHLGPSATDAEIARAWPAWFAANRATIGPDPDLLRPGQRLRPPAPDAQDRPAGGMS